jgi:hypothetical protein
MTTQVQVRNQSLPTRRHVHVLETIALLWLALLGDRPGVTKGDAR